MEIENLLLRLTIKISMVFNLAKSNKLRNNFKTINQQKVHEFCFFKYIPNYHTSEKISSSRTQEFSKINLSKFCNLL